MAPPDYPPSRFGNWKQGSTPLDPDELFNLLQYLVAHFTELEFGRDRERHFSPERLVVVVTRLNEYLCVSPRNLNGLQRRLEGYYWLFRPSIMAPGRYLRGLLGMRWVVAKEKAVGSPYKGMIRTCEAHRHPGDKTHPMPTVSESYDGFALVKKSILFLFMSELYEGDDRGPLLITRLHGFLPSDHKRPLQIAWGRTTGASGSAYALPTVLVRVTDGELHEPSGKTPSPIDLEQHAMFQKGRETRRHQAPYLDRLLDCCAIVDADDLPPTVLSQITALNQEASWFSDQSARAGGG
jgi:hypothetical protein